MFNLAEKIRELLQIDLNSADIEDHRRGKSKLTIDLAFLKVSFTSHYFWNQFMVE